MMYNLKNKYTPVFSWIVLLVFMSSMVFSQKKKEKLPVYKDHNQSFNVRVNDLLARMTLEEKISQMMSRTPADLTRFDIPGYEWSGQVGHCLQSRHGGASTIFPHGIAQASTWNRDLIYKVGTAISDESRAQFKQWLSKSGTYFLGSCCGNGT